MGAPGLIDTVQLAVTLVFALPLALFGLQWVATGRPLGGAFLAVAGLMVLLPRFLRNPLDPGDAAEAAVDRVLTRDDE